MLAMVLRLLLAGNGPAAQAPQQVGPANAGAS
jgi:hypothetical protein